VWLLITQTIFYCLALQEHAIETYIRGRVSWFLCFFVYLFVLCLCFLWGVGLYICLLFVLFVMEYSVLSDLDVNVCENLLKRRGVLFPFDERARVSPAFFMFHYLGLRPFGWQASVLRAVEGGDRRVVVCSSRQIGKSVLVAVLALWAAWFNLFPSGVGGDTKVGIVSRSDSQAKKLVREIRKLIRAGDSWCLSKFGVEKGISSGLVGGERSTLFMLTFENGSSIQSFPPTDAIRGETLDWVFVDEARYVPDEVFNEVIVPTVSSTDGGVFVTSTPAGVGGWFFDLFDPEDRFGDQGFCRFWFPWSVCERGAQRGFIEREKVRYERMGAIRSFDQEYGALFTAAVNKFFDPVKVDEGVVEGWSYVGEWRGECCLGIDFGIKRCRTVLSVCGLDGGVVRLLYQFVYPEGSEDHSIVDDVVDLSRRFNLVRVVSDDCPQGHGTNQALVGRGFNVELFNFRSDQSKGERGRGYYLFRSALCAGKVGFPLDRDLVGEMKGLEEEQKSMFVSIRAPPSLRDDRIDSFMMAALFFVRVDDGGGFSSGVVDSDDPFGSEVVWGGRGDSVWDGLSKDFRQGLSKGGLRK
jgi:hypothetical protein